MLKVETEEISNEKCIIFQRHLLLLCQMELGGVRRQVLNFITTEVNLLFFV